MSCARVIFRLLLGGQLCLAPLLLAAADKPAAEKPAADAGGVIYPRGSGVQAEPATGRPSGYSAVLVAALLLAGAGGWLFWRGRTVSVGGAGARRLAIAETKSLGNRQYLVVASYEDKKFLLSVCPGRIDLLTPLDGPAPMEKPRT